MTLAKNAVHNNRLMEYVDRLEFYIASLDKKEESDVATKEETTDDNKTE